MNLQHIIYFIITSLFSFHFIYKRILNISCYSDISQNDITQTLSLINNWFKKKQAYPWRTHADFLQTLILSFVITTYPFFPLFIPSKMVSHLLFRRHWTSSMRDKTMSKTDLISQERERWHTFTSVRPKMKLLQGLRSTYLQERTALSGWTTICVKGSRKGKNRAQGR